MNEVITTGSLREIWVSSMQGSAASCAYNESFTLHLNGTIDQTLLKHAIIQTAARNDALSATFSSDGKIMKKKEFLTTPITAIDISNRSETERWSYLKKLLDQEAATPFDLESGPLWRARIVMHSDHETDLIFTAHHLVCDGWSINILVREIGLLYDSLRTGHQPPSDTQASFFSFVDDHNDSLNFERRKTVIEYWKKRFHPPLPVLDLPADHIRPAMRTYSARSKRMAIENSLIEKVKLSAAKAGCNPFSFLAGAYAVLLNRLSGSEDIVVGIPVAGQSYYKNPNVAGHCVTMLPVRIAVSPNTPFSEFAVKLQENLFDAYDHHEITFGDLIHELNVPRDPTRIPLVPVGFTYAKLLAPGEFGFDGLSASYSVNDRLFETFEVYATVIESTAGWELLWHFNSDLFDDITAKRWLDQYKILLMGITDAPHCTLNRLPILTESEKFSFLHQWNATDQPFDLDDTVVKMFERQVNITPEAIALVFQGESFSYRQVNDKAGRIAAILTQLGAGPDIPAGLCLERSPEMVFSLLGILKSGAAYIPIDPHFPDERINYILKDAEAKVLVTTPEISKRLPDINIPLVNPFDLPDNSESTAGLAALGKHCAYIIYTSGSTGKPKGVEIRHFSLANFCISMKKIPGMVQSDSLLAVTTISFDIAGLELLCPLTCGARIILAGRETSSDAIALLEMIKEKKPSIMQATPATWSMLLDAGWQHASGMKVLCGGEAMTRTLADRLTATGAEVWNMYGPTETTIWSAVWRVTAGDKKPPVGLPIDNTKLHVLDANMSMVPTGAAGELYISGIGLAAGYHNREKLTEEKFTPSPFSPSLYSDIEGRVYKTGDIARRLNDGTIEILGRSDFQMKIRGFRIEPGEIESELTKHPSIQECVIIDGDDVKGNKILVAYIVFRKMITVSVEELRSFLSQTLPEYMIPTRFITLEAIPRLANNKIDRTSLPKPELESTTGHQEIIPPSTATQHQIHSIWRETLGIDTISIRDNFFTIGGHSLLAVQIFTSIHKQTGINLPLATLLSNPTIEKLAGKIDTQITIPPKIASEELPVQVNDTVWSYLVPIQAQGSKIPFFCVHGVGGNVLHYNQIVKYLDNDQPLYGLQCRGLDGESRPFASIEEMATAYIQEIKQIQPHGPYILGGGSMGGVASFEMARQLTNAGEKVAKLIMFDSINPKGITGKDMNEKEPGTIDTSSTDPHHKKPLIEKIKHGIWCRIRDNLRMQRCEMFLLRKIPIPHEIRYWYIEQKNISISEHYSPGEYSGELLYFRAVNNYQCTDPYRGWKNIIKGGITFFDFPCSHEDTMEHPDLLKQLGELLGKKVDAVAG